MLLWNQPWWFKLILIMSFHFTRFAIVTLDVSFGCSAHPFFNVPALFSLSKLWLLHTAADDIERPHRSLHPIFDPSCGGNIVHHHADTGWPTDECFTMAWVPHLSTHVTEKCTLLPNICQSIFKCFILFY